MMKKILVILFVFNCTLGFSQDYELVFNEVFKISDSEVIESFKNTIIKHNKQDSIVSLERDIKLFNQKTEQHKDELEKIMKEFALNNTHPSETPACNELETLSAKKQAIIKKLESQKKLVDKRENDYKRCKNSVSRLGKCGTLYDDLKNSSDYLKNILNELEDLKKKMILITNECKSALESYNKKVDEINYPIEFINNKNSIIELGQSITEKADFLKKFLLEND